MKIFVNARFLTQPLSGVQRYGIECSRQIKKLCEDLTFICPGDILHKEIAEELGARIVGRNRGHLWEQFDLPLFLAKYKNPPLVNLANTAPMFYKNNYITIHDLAFYHHPEWFSRYFAAWYNILVPRIAYKSRHLFSVSETIKNDLVKCYNVSPAKISVTYNGISEGMIARPPDKGIAKEKIILSVGSFNKRKNHQSLIKAFLGSEISSSYQLVIIGDRNRVFSDGDIDEALLENTNIKICGHCDEPELICWYQKAEIIASVSLYEGFGIPLLEGLYYGCKILCSDIPVYRELFAEYAVFCDPGNINDIIDNLSRVVTTTTNSEHNANALLDKYSYHNSAKTMLDKIQGAS
jgi:glycosyltransferase involved in cell wall biosynthesis